MNDIQVKQVKSIVVDKDFISLVYESDDAFFDGMHYIKESIDNIKKEFSMNGKVDFGIVHDQITDKEYHLVLEKIPFIKYVIEDVEVKRKEIESDYYNETRSLISFQYKCPNCGHYQSGEEFVKPKDYYYEEYFMDTRCSNCGANINFEYALPEKKESKIKNLANGINNKLKLRYYFNKLFENISNNLFIYLTIIFITIFAFQINMSASNTNQAWLDLISIMIGIFSALAAVNLEMNLSEKKERKMREPAIFIRDYEVKMKDKKLLEDWVNLFEIDPDENITSEEKKSSNALLQESSDEFSNSFLTLINAGQTPIMNIEYHFEWKNRQKILTLLKLYESRTKMTSANTKLLTVNELVDLKTNYSLNAFGGDEELNIKLNDYEGFYYNHVFKESRFSLDKNEEIYIIIDNNENTPLLQSIEYYSSNYCSLDFPKNNIDMLLSSEKGKIYIPKDYLITLEAIITRDDGIKVDYSDDYKKYLSYVENKRFEELKPDEGDFLAWQNAYTNEKGTRDHPAEDYSLVLIVNFIDVNQNPCEIIYEICPIIDYWEDNDKYGDSWYHYLYHENKSEKEQPFKAKLTSRFIDSSLTRKNYKFINKEYYRSNQRFL